MTRSRSDQSTSLFAVKLWIPRRRASRRARSSAPTPVSSRFRTALTALSGLPRSSEMRPRLLERPTSSRNIARPGVIHHTGTVAKIHCGRLDTLLAGYVQQMRAAGIDVTATADMPLEIWRKFVVLSGTSGITASTRQSLGVIREDADMRAFFFRLMHETMAVGHAAGVEFPPDFPAELERLVAGFSPMMKASMANDLDAGNRLELDWLAGKVVALGHKYGIPTPAQEAVYAILKPYRMGRVR